MISLMNKLLLFLGGEKHSTSLLEEFGLLRSRSIQSQLVDN
jgi:hypothetical protein